MRCKTAQIILIQSSAFLQTETVAAKCQLSYALLYSLAVINFFQSSENFSFFNPNVCCNNYHFARDVTFVFAHFFLMDQC